MSESQITVQPQNGKRTVVSNMVKWLLGVSLAVCTSLAHCEEIKIAVAANFKTTAQIITDNFQQKTGHRVTLITASSSALANQIFHGAPYDLFLSADLSRPQWLIKNNKADANSLTLYATGQLAFFSQKHSVSSLEELKSTLKMQTRKLAIANPKLAPYGKSAKELIELLGISNTLENKLVLGNNVIQALQFVQSGNAESGLVSVSQLLESGTIHNYFIIPKQLHSPISQYGVITNHGKNNPLAKQFLNYLVQDSETVISNKGYLIGVNND